MEKSSPFFIPESSPEEIKKEKAAARVLRQSSWWKRKLSTGLCCYCGRRFNPAELTMDHIVPLVRGGRSTKSNIAACCKDCNSKKKHMLPMEWGEYLDSLKQDDE